MMYYGGGGTDDNDIFSSLVNIILAKIQDESEKEDGDKYDFQIFSFDDNFESNGDIFKRINKLYRNALEQKLNVDRTKLQSAFVVDENKFPLNKLRYTISKLESFSFRDGKNSLNGRDILGDFFEGIIRDGFKQTKGQFFTHNHIVKFLLWGLQLDNLAIECVNRDTDLPYFIDPSAGSGTFLIEYMKFITDNLKRRFYNKLATTKQVQDKFDDWFKPDHRENRWAKDYIYGIEHNFNLGTATKVNMILHGDGSSNIFVKDALLPLRYFGSNKDISKKFDVVVTNPPFSVSLDNDTKKSLADTFIFGDKKNSENLFIERWYQLLKPNGRLGAVLPESVFDATENKYIRLFIYKYFNVKAIVSMPSLSFEPFTSTKTSLLFAQKKTEKEIKEWNRLWEKYSKEWSNLKTRCENLIKVYLHNQDRKKFLSIKNLSRQEEQAKLIRLLKNYMLAEDYNLDSQTLIERYADEISWLCQYDKKTTDAFGYVNTNWVFSELALDLNYKVFIAEVANVGYKRTTRGQKPQPNDLYRTDNTGKILVDDNIQETALDYLRKIEWD